MKTFPSNHSFFNIIIMYRNREIIQVSKFSKIFLKITKSSISVKSVMIKYLLLLWRLWFNLKHDLNCTLERRLNFDSFLRVVDCRRYLKKRRFGICIALILIDNTLRIITIDYLSINIFEHISNLKFAKKF